MYLAGTLLSHPSIASVTFSPFAEDSGLWMILKLVVLWGKESLEMCTWHVKSRVNLFLH